MKIKTKPLPYEQVLALPRPAHREPRRPSLLFRSLMRALGAPDLKDAGFSYTTEGMDKPGEEPCLILMNHSSFIDLEIVSAIFYPKPYCIVCTSDGFVGQGGADAPSGLHPHQQVRQRPAADGGHAARPAGGKMQRPFVPGGQLQL